MTFHFPFCNATPVSLVERDIRTLFRKGSRNKSRILSSDGTSEKQRTNWHMSPTRSLQIILQRFCIRTRRCAISTLSLPSTSLPILLFSNFCARSQICSWWSVGSSVTVARDWQRRPDESVTWCARDCSHISTLSRILRDSKPTRATFVGSFVRSRTFHASPEEPQISARESEVWAYSSRLRRRHERVAPVHDESYFISAGTLFASSPLAFPELPYSQLLRETTSPPVATYVRAIPARNDSLNQGVSWRRARPVMRYLHWLLGREIFLARRYWEFAFSNFTSACRLSRIAILIFRPGIFFTQFATWRCFLPSCKT